jgi:hypothetical protein
MTNVPAPLYCANHPQTLTSLRCNHCEKPICPKCAVQTPTGYRCKECVRGQQKVFETTVWYDYLVAFLIVSVMSFLGSLVAYKISWFVIFLAPLYGGIIAEIVRQAVRKRRSKTLNQVVLVAAILGALPGLGMTGFSLALFPIIWEGVYVVMMISTLYYRLSGIRIAR